MSETTCPRCRRASLRRRTHHLTGDVYYVCDNYPECRFVGYMDELQVDEKLPVRSTPVA